jgi:hypothetical protein
MNRRSCLSNNDLSMPFMRTTGTGRVITRALRVSSRLRRIGCICESTGILSRQMKLRPFRCARKGPDGRTRANVSSWHEALVRCSATVRQVSEETPTFEVWADSASDYRDKLLGLIPL